MSDASEGAWPEINGDNYHEVSARQRLRMRFSVDHYNMPDIDGFESFLGEDPARVGLMIHGADRDLIRAFMMYAVEHALRVVGATDKQILRWYGHHDDDHRRRMISAIDARKAAMADLAGGTPSADSTARGEG